MQERGQESRSSSFPFKEKAVLCLSILALSPLGLGYAWTTIAENLLISLYLVVWFVWWRRGWPVPEGVRFVADFLLMGLLLVVVWRGQMDLVATWGRVAYWPVICLAGACVSAGGARFPRGEPWRLLPLSLLVSLGGLAASQVILPGTLPARPYWYELSYLVPRGLVVLGLFCVAMIIQSEPFQSARKRFVSVLLLLALIAVGKGWSWQATTMATWWQASRLERSVLAWQGEQIQAAKEVRRLYSRVLNTLEERGGGLVRAWRLDFVLRYRMAEVAKRMDQPARMLAALPPGTWTNAWCSTLLADLWTGPCLDRLRRRVEQDPAYLRRLAATGGVRIGLYADHEISPDGEEAWLLDRWGRVFYSREGSPLQLAWESAPEGGRSDAVDLELWDGAMAVAFADGEVRLTGDLPAWFPQPWHMRLRPGYSLVDIEPHPTAAALVALNSFGEFSVVGEVPKDFPIPSEPLFRWGAAADLEISRDGLAWYVLDVFGAIHTKSGGEPVPFAEQTQDSPFSTIKTHNAPYWEGQAMALDIELDPLDRGICLLNRSGEAWTIADPPFRKPYRPYEEENVTGLGVSLAVRSDGAMVLLYAPGNLVVVE